ncbi:MAG: transcriptional regulator PpsR [Gemmatimonas sp.]|jgi:transcriptional regulator PpsR|uniref:transcriptional regulator PpsR n=1 Tax=Gemmatimonas sp. TaxID=1962908 RepID=UPI0022C241E4|nr:transcriptional regulator PpsR [Gemmatimonas sp.]MCA2982231.1 transcriptional regulator PpsR [Gemmatimonas sp.]MCA2994837.1 transcriptional regulator PpsR [Gemmatimonas sp.]MCE2955197.1 transcriptional regulator PpsR [Gemmatimonas sp.]MCZ8012603.1 transcriptional regulator PpsR [Gemmatimonas sp.]MCZ8268422.1 transcriptional regulator PpsR [Gemmatimonas sp.]
MASSVKPFDANNPAIGELDARSAASLLAVAGDIALVMDGAGVIRDVALMGGGDTQFDTATQWIGRPWNETVSGDSRGKIDTLLKEAIHQGVSKRRQVNHLMGDVMDVPVSYTTIKLGRDGSLVAVGRDMRHVSALQQRLVEAQQAMERDYWRLRHVETRYRLLFQLASDGILVLDATNLKVLDANAAAGQLFGEPTDRLIGRVFPLGMDATAARALEDLLGAARSAGRSGDIGLTLHGGRAVHASASCFRQEQATLLLVRFSPAELPAGGGSGANSPSRLLDLLERSPDAFVVTDLEGVILTANRAFLDITELASEEQVRGTPLATYIGRPGADFPVFTSMLRKNGVVRLMATSARGLHGNQSEVEVSAVWVPEGEEPCIGFTIRDIGRRLASGPQGARDLTRAVEELTSLVGRVSLRDLVRDTVDLVERHFIEAALELTNDNRTSAAEVLGVSRQSLYVKLRRHRLVSPGGDREEDVSG